MKLKEILKMAGGAALSSVPPYGPLALSLINAVLPDDKKLTESSTAQNAESALNEIPEANRNSLLETTVKAEHNTLQAMLLAESNSQQTTRPRIALGCFQIYSACTLIFTVIIAYAVGQSEQPLNELQNLWPLAMGLYAPFPAVLYAYFGMLKKEHENRLNAANGRSTHLGLFTSLAAKMAKR